MLLSIDMVENSSDSGPGSLRNMIASAAAGSTIEFDMTPGHVTSQITLTTGQIVIPHNLKIVGPGAAGLTISGNSSSRIFEVPSGVAATISGLTLADGNAAFGGAVANTSGSVKLAGDGFTSNQAVLSGGAIFNHGGSLSIDGCTLSNNTSQNTVGGGLYVEGGMVTIDDSTFASNIAASDGGGICAVSGSVVALNSTLANNSSSLYGGGIYVGAGVQATFINSTVADNTASEGGGVFTPGAVTMGNTIVADNTGTIAAPDYAGVLATDLGNNLLGNDQGTGIGFSQPSDQLNVDPLLGSLGNYGGPTQTMPLLPGSPAIDAGSNSIVPQGVVTDQRGFYRFANGTTDIGAFEVQTYVVTNINDGGPGSLRTAMTNANTAGGSTILFATSGTISLQSALPAITMDVNIDGPGANTLDISGNSAFQVFNIASGVNATVAGLTVTEGFSESNGGGIDDSGNLTLTDCTVSNSTAEFGGGIMLEAASSLTMTGCTVSNNTTTGYGGGIYDGGDAVLLNSTIAENSATALGGGIDNGGTLSLVNCTVADNSADWRRRHQQRWLGDARQYDRRLQQLDDELSGPDFGGNRHERRRGTT